MILATVAEFPYIPTTWNNTSNSPPNFPVRHSWSYLRPDILHRTQHTCGSLALILGVEQFFISVIAMAILFSILPSGQMFSDRVAGKSRPKKVVHEFGTHKDQSGPTLGPISIRTRIGISILYSRVSLLGN